MIKSEEDKENERNTLKDMIKTKAPIEEIDKYIEQHNIDVNFRHSYESTLLNISVSAERYEVIELLIRKGASVKSDQKRLLSIAIEKNNINMFNFLRDKGAELLKKYLNNFLTSAIQTKNIDIKFIELLINEGADVNNNYHDHFYYSPVLKEVIMNQNNANIVKLLIEKGANVTYVDGDGDTYLMLVCRMFNSKYGAKPTISRYSNNIDYYKELFDILLDRISINQKNYEGKTCIDYLSGESKKIFIEIYNLKKILEIMTSYDSKIPTDENIFDSDKVDDNNNIFIEVIKFLLI